MTTSNLKLLTEIIRGEVPSTGDDLELDALVDALDALDSQSIEMLLEATGGAIDSETSAGNLAEIVREAADEPVVYTTMVRSLRLDSNFLGHFSLANEVEKSQGKTIELPHRFCVGLRQAGEVFEMPAGLVHAVRKQQLAVDD